MPVSHSSAWWAIRGVKPDKPEDIRQSFEPYFTAARLETETDPYVVVHLATKLAHAGIYTEDEVRKTAELWVRREGNNALTAAVSPGKTAFAKRYEKALETAGIVTAMEIDVMAVAELYGGSLMFDLADLPRCRTHLRCGPGRLRSGTCGWGPATGCWLT